MRGSWFLSLSTILGIGLLGFTFTSVTSTNAQTAPEAGTQVFFNNAPAQSVPAPSSGDPQARVGRVSLIDGTVSSHTPDQNAWSYSTLNYPVVSGNSFWTEPGSRAEIQVGSDAIRMDGATEVDINELDDRGTRIEISQGMVNLHVGNVEPGEIYQIITPHETINLLQPGTYRVKTGDNIPDEVAVLKGRTQVGDPETSLTISAGETAIITPGNPPHIAVRETDATPFDNWSLDRDNYEEPRQVVHYVSTEMTGYEDLDRYGTWQNDPGNGNVWIPNSVPADWAPYHQGHWVWVSPWGWTWVDEAPWGFAPFHYGRWAYMHDHWGWVPGRVTPRPVYAPALVAFIGGSNWNVSVGIGDQPVGWFPLGPNEVYHPGYHVSHDYVRNMNVTNVTNVRMDNYNHGAEPRNSFANRRYATVIAAKDFSAQRSVAQSAIRVPPEKLAAAPVSTSAAPPVAIEHHATPQNAPHGNYVPGNAGSNVHGPDHRDGTPMNNVPNISGNVAQPTAPHAPSAPIPPAVYERPNARAEAAQQQHHEQEVPVVNAAPGPAIQHRDRPPGYQPSMRVPVIEPATNTSATAHVQTPQTPTLEPVHLPESHPEQPIEMQRPVRAAVQQQMTPQLIPQHQPPHELEIQHPQQAAPLTPSHEGWVRKAPEQPAAKPAETPHEGPRAEPAHAEQPHPEHGHEDHNPEPNQQPGH